MVPTNDKLEWKEVTPAQAFTRWLDNDLLRELPMRSVQHKATDEQLCASKVKSYDPVLYTKIVAFASTIDLNGEQLTVRAKIESFAMDVVSQLLLANNDSN